MGEICTYQKCPKCGGKFERNHKSSTDTELICFTCLTRPTRYYLDFGKPGLRYISRDEWGRRLTDETANALLADIRRHGNIDPSKFVRRKKEPYIFRNIVTRWLQHAENQMTQDDLSYGTYDLKRRIHGRFIKAFGQEDIREIRQHHVNKWLMGLSGKPNYRRSVISQIKTVWTFARDTEKLIKEIPDFPLPKQAEKIIPVADGVDREKVLSEIEPQHRPIFRFLCLTGCRPSMARALQWADIRWKDNVIHFQHNFSGNNNRLTSKLKNGKDFEFPLYGELRDLLNGLPRSITGYVFINPNTGEPYTRHFYRLLDTAFKHAGIPRMPLKNFTRHSFINSLLDQGWHDTDVADLTGHDPETLRKNYKRMNVRRLGSLLDNPQKAELSGSG